MSKCHDNNWFRCLLCDGITMDRSSMHKHLANSHGWDRDQDAPALRFYQRVRPSPELLEHKLPKYDGNKIQVADLGPEETWGPTRMTFQLHIT